jgi:hypothetical protein
MDEAAVCKISAKERIIQSWIAPDRERVHHLPLAHQLAIGFSDLALVIPSTNMAARINPPIKLTKNPAFPTLFTLDAPRCRLCTMPDYRCYFELWAAYHWGVQETQSGLSRHISQRARGNADNNAETSRTYQSPLTAVMVAASAGHSGSQAVAVRHQNHGGVAVAVAIALRRLDQPLDLGCRWYWRESLT